MFVSLIINQFLPTIILLQYTCAENRFELIIFQWIYALYICLNRPISFNSINYIIFNKKITKHVLVKSSNSVLILLQFSLKTEANLKTFQVSIQINLVPVCTLLKVINAHINRNHWFSQLLDFLLIDKQISSNTLKQVFFRELILYSNSSEFKGKLEIGKNRS